MINIYDDAALLISKTADFFIALAASQIEEKGVFTVALSGGSSPARLYSQLTAAGYRERVNWEKVFFFFGDERYVPLDHELSNYRMARETLFDPLRINSFNIFPVDTSLAPDEAAAAYEKVVRQHVKESRFDLVLLGLGDNSHTASLFPHTEVLEEKKMLVRALYVDEVKQHRITFTAPLINKASNIVFLVYGAGKAEAVAHILLDDFRPAEFPAQLVRPMQGNTYWFLDAAAGTRVGHLRAS